MSIPGDYDLYACEPQSDQTVPECEETYTSETLDLEYDVTNSTPGLGNIPFYWEYEN